MRLANPSAIGATAVAAALAVAAFTPFSALADSKQITLRLADSFPTTHFISKEAIVPWMEDITKQTGGKVKFEHFPAQQLGKAPDLLNLTQSGVADIGYVGVSYVSDKMPLSGVAQLPGAFSTACEGTKAYMTLARGDTVRKTDYEANKVRLLFGFLLEPYQFYTVAKAVQMPDDVKGLKLRSTGGAMDIFARKLNAVPVRMAAPEVRESLSRGTLDGLIFPNESVISYDLQNMVKFGTKGGNFGSFIVTLAINEDRWRKLPKDVQTAMNKANEAIMPKICKHIDDGIETVVQKLTASGVKFHTLTAGERKAFSEITDTVAAEWADGLDKRGKPGSQVLKEFKAALAKAATN